MPIVDRSLADVLRDVFHNLQEIVRSEVRLAKSEIADEAARATSPVVTIVAGAVTTLFAALFLVLSSVFALALILPVWAATLIPGTILAVVASVMLASGVRRFRHRHAVLEGTVESTKEDVAWAQQPSK